MIIDISFLNPIQQVIIIFKQTLITIYAWPIILLVLLTAVLIAAVLLLWIRFCRERDKTFVSVIMLLLSIFFILAVTILSRDIGSGSELSLVPFSSWINYFKGNNEEFLRTNIFNMLLFLPFGALLYAVRYTRSSFKGLLMLTSVSAILLSCSVELGQWFLQCGEVETDDVIHNVLGAVIGVLLAKLVCDLYRKHIKQSDERQGF